MRRRTKRSRCPMWTPRCWLRCVLFLHSRCIGAFRVGCLDVTVVHFHCSITGYQLLFTSHWQSDGWNCQGRFRFLWSVKHLRTRMSTSNWIASVCSLLRTRTCLKSSTNGMQTLLTSSKSFCLNLFWYELITCSLGNSHSFSFWMFFCVNATIVSSSGGELHGY